MQLYLFPISSVTSSVKETLIYSKEEQMHQGIFIIYEKLKYKSLSSTHVLQFKFLTIALVTYKFDQVTYR